MMNRNKLKFGWKRKLGEGVTSSIKDKFENDAIDDLTAQDLEDKGIDWLTLRPKKPGT